VSGASVEVNITFVSLNPDVCIFVLYVVFAQKLIKIVHLYIIRPQISKFLCGTHTKSNWKWILKYADRDIQKKEYLTVACL
jgi:hypothetical protein